MKHGVKVEGGRDRDLQTRLNLVRSDVDYKDRTCEPPVTLS